MKQAGVLKIVKCGENMPVIYVEEMVIALTINKYHSLTN